jgi:hypothetical protein
MSERSLFRRRREQPLEQQPLEQQQLEQQQEQLEQPPPSQPSPPSPPPLLADVANDAVEILRSELRTLRLTELLRRADDAGVDADRLDAAAESAEQPKEAVVALIVQQLAPSVGDLLAHALAGGEQRDDTVLLAADELRARDELRDRDALRARDELGASDERGEPDALGDSDAPPAFRAAPHSLAADDLSDSDDSDGAGMPARDIARAARTSERRTNLVEMMMRQFTTDRHDWGAGAGGAEGADECEDAASEQSLASSVAAASQLPRAVATRQRMGSLSRPLARHQHAPSRRKQDSPVWRPGGAAASASRSAEHAVAPPTPTRTPRAGGGNDTWHVADCAARSAEQRLARRKHPLAAKENLRQCFALLRPFPMRSPLGPTPPIDVLRLCAFW